MHSALVTIVFIASAIAMPEGSSNSPNSELSQTERVEQTQPESPFVPINSDHNVLRVTAAEQILFNGQTVNQNDLANLLSIIVQMEPQPELELRFDAMLHYEFATQIMRIIRASGVTRIGVIGNEKLP